MKQLKSILLTLLLFSFSGFLASAQAAGSISGTVSYSGTQEGTNIVAVFEFPLSCIPSNLQPFAVAAIPALGSYTLSDLPDGTYYVAAVIMTCGTDCELQSTDPWGIYGGCDTSTPVVISGGNAVSGIDITLVDGTAESPNPFSSFYDTWSYSRHQNNGYSVSLGARDEGHSLTSVRVTGPGFAGWTNLVFNQDRWEASSISFGSTHPAPPLTYDFEILDSGVTHFQTEIVESFVEAFATNLSPANGESVTGTPVFSWTGLGQGYEYNIGLYGNGVNWYSSRTTETSIVYGGSPLTIGQTYNWYVEARDRYGNLSQTSSKSFVYTSGVTLTVATEGSGGGTITSSPAGIDCGSDCENDYPLGGQVRLTAVPDPGSAFAGWSGGGCYGISDCFPDLSTNTTVTATFSLAGSISGNVSYGGTPTGPIYVAAFTSPISCDPPNPEPYKYVEIQNLGDYTIPDLPDGTYYMGSVIIACGTDCDLQSTDPWGVYGGCDAATQVVISGDNAVSGIDITLNDGTAEDPNPLYDSYQANADSRHENDAYWVQLRVDDQTHHATSVSVTGPGISGSMDLAFDTDEWKSFSLISFGPTQPVLPLTYTFTITDSVEGTYIRTDVVESFVHVFATNLSPSGGEFVISTPVFSWTGVGSGYTYNVGLYGSGVDWRARDLTATSVTYDGPSLTASQTYNWYVEVRDIYDNISKTSSESFVYTQSATLTVIKNGSGTVISSPAGIDCGSDCENDYPAGSQVVLTAVPDSGSAFAGWSGGGCNGIGDCIPALISDTTVTATFTVPGSDPITLSVLPSPASVPADSSTGFTFQTQAPTIGGNIMFELFHDVDSNGVIDGNEWPIWKRMFTDNQYVDYDGFLSGDTNFSVLQITIGFDFNGGLFPAGDYIARVKNTIGESATVPLEITPVSASQAVGGFVYEQGTTTPVPNAIVYAVNPVTENFVSAAVSGGDGAFSMLIPAPGEIVVGSDKDGYISNDMSLLTVPADGIANQNIYLILPDAHITGTVTGYYTGSPVWGAEVGARVDGTNTKAVTDIDGSFSLPALDGVEWQLNLDEPPGFFGGLAVTHNFETNPVIVPAVSGPNRVDFTVHKINAWIDGNLLDESGSLAIEGADFFVYRINTPDLALQRLNNDGTSDALGQVSVGVENGDWRARLSVSSIRVNGTPKEMVPPGQADVLNLLIGEHRPVTMQPYYADGAVEGTVYEADGVTPAADVSVNAHSNDALNGLAQISVGPVDTGTRTDANGHYRIPLLGGTWTITAWLPDGGGQVSRNITLTTDGNDIIDQPGETLTNIDFGIQNISVTPTSLDFGLVSIGNTSATQILTISNTGTRNLDVSNIELAGTDSDMFSLAAGGGNPCSEPPFSLSQNSSCTLSLTFSPTSDGAKSALVTISSNDMDEPSLEVQLTGNVNGKTLTIYKDGTGTGKVTSSPAGIDCGDQCIALFAEGTLVELTTIGDQHSAFENWTGGGCSGNGSCLTTMNIDKSITATFTFDNTPPSSPTGLTGSQVGVQVNLSWTTNSEPDILGYNIYRDGVKINTSLRSSNSYSESVAGGKTYVYNVTAVDRAQNESPFSNAVSIATSIILPEITYPTTGTLLIDSEITVRGTADPGSTVEIFVNGISQGTTIANSSGTFTFTGVLVNTGENSITVVSTNSYGETSPISDVVTVPMDIRPSVPQGLAASPGDTTATITWDIVSESDVQGYNIYRDGAQVNNNLLTETTYTDVRLTNGRAYSYTVTAEDTNGSESNKSNTITVTPVAGPGWEIP